MTKLCIGLTGGIGSGKTVVSDYFQTLGVTVVDADLASRVVVMPGKPALAQIEAHFGSEVISDSGELDRAALRKKVFTDTEEKHWLESLLHPLIREEITRQRENASSTYVILVSPLLIESDQYKTVDRVLVIDAPTTTQLERTMQRDNNNAVEVEAIMKHQLDRQERLAFADDVLTNDRHLEHIYQQADALHQQYLTLAKEKP